MTDLITLDKNNLPSKKREEEIKALLADRNWRLRNLYVIKNKQGAVVTFEPNWAQEQLLKPHYLNIILKARQLGISTFFSILFLDTCLFNDHIQAAIIADSKDVARELFIDKVKFAYDNLPPWVKQMTNAYRDNVNELRFSNGSSFRIGTSLRGGTLQLLHITEFAKTCVENPRKADEIMSGALNTLQAGQFACIESTARGKAGHFYEMCMKAFENKKQGKELTALDWKPHFFSWFDHPEYVLEDESVTIDRELTNYFKKLEDGHGIILNDKQKRWYAKKYETQGEDMKREYPSTPEEAFEAQNEGYYFAKHMNRARHERRICRIPRDSHVPQFAAWDIGWTDATAIWIFQCVGKEVHFLDYYENSGEALEHYVNWIRKRNYDIQRHFLPHDSAGRSAATGKAYVDYAREMGLKCEVLKIEHNKLVDIEMVRNIFPRLYFDSDRCTQGIKCVENYRKEWNDKLECYRERPLHNWCLHGDTKIRTLSGWKEISNVCEGDYVWGFSLNENRLIPSLVTKSGKTGINQKLIEVGLGSGKSIKCTPDHRFMLYTKEWKEAKDLKQGDSLMPFYEVLNRNYIEVDLNDGSFCDEHRFVWSRFNGTIPKHFHIDHIDHNRYNNDPRNLQILSKDAHCQKTFQGLNQNERKKIDKTSENREFYARKDLYQFCKRCKEEYWGSYKTCYCSKRCRDKYRSERDKNGGVMSRTKEKRAEYYRNYQKRKNHLVRFVRECESADVYDLEVPETNSFVAEGVVVHNSSHGTDAFIYAVNAVSKMTGNGGLSAEEWKNIRQKYT